MIHIRNPEIGQYPQRFLKSFGRMPGSDGVALMMAYTRKLVKNTNQQHNGEVTEHADSDTNTYINRVNQIIWGN